MSIEYDIYLKRHIESVRHAISYIMTYVPLETLNDILPELNTQELGFQITSHDQSKFGITEYQAYDRYFYGDKKTPEIEKEFQYAWLHHQHVNPHHWQYWTMINDDGTGEVIALDMPDNDIFEMICDWWSFSWVKHFDIIKNVPLDEASHTIGLDEIFDWYQDHENRMILSEKTRTKVEKLLEEIRKIIEENSN